MRRDIVIDNCIAKNFSNPMDLNYRKLIDWIQRFDQDSEENAFLVVSKKLICEYHRTACAGSSTSNIVVLVDKLTREGRLVLITKPQIEGFKAQYFAKKLVKKLRSNGQDRDHIPVVLLSDRKYFLSIDKNLIHDLINFPGFIVRAETRPERLPYSM